VTACKVLACRAPVCRAIVCNALVYSAVGKAALRLVICHPQAFLNRPLQQPLRRPANNASVQILITHRTGFSKKPSARPKDLCQVRISFRECIRFGFFVPPSIAQSSGPGPAIKRFRASAFELFPAPRNISLPNILNLVAISSRSRRRRRTLLLSNCRLSLTSSAKRGELPGGHGARLEHAPNGISVRKNRDFPAPSRRQDPKGPIPIRPTARNHCSRRGNMLRRSRVRIQQS